MSAVNSIWSDSAPPVKLGKYELIAKVAEGGMAEVYLARLCGPMNFQKIVVLKTIHPHLLSQTEFLQMLFDEARLAALIKHPHVVDIYELGVEGGTYFIAMEYLDGQPLLKVLSRGAAGDRLDPLSSARIIADAAEGLHAAHELKSMSGKPLGLVHRDVSPGNIMVLYDNHAKLLDFGIAKARGRITISGEQDFKGKLGYVAPEQITGDPVDPRTDVFSLGIVMWEALTLRRLFARSEMRSVRSPGFQTPLVPPSRISNHAPQELDAVCVKALATKPDQRFQTAGAFKDALDEVLRRLGYFRESDAIRTYMERVFASQRMRHQSMLRAAAGESGPIHFEFPPELAAQASAEAGDASAADDDDVEIEIQYGDAGESVAPAMTADMLASVQSRRGALRWGLLAAGLLAAGIAVATVVIGGGSSEPVASSAKASVDQPAKPRHGTDGADGANAAPAGSKPQAGENGDAKPATDGDAKPATDGDAEPATDGDAKPATDGDAEPATDGDAEPATDGDAKPATNGDAKPATRDSKPDPAPKPRRSVRELHDDGSKQYLLGNYRAARKLFQQALDANSRHAPSHRGLGLVYQAERRNRRAVQHFQKYLRLEPNASDAAAIRKRIEKLGGK